MQLLALVALTIVVAVGRSAAAEPLDAPVLHAVRMMVPIRLDGRLDDEAWRNAPVFSRFVQQVPVPQAPATFPTEVQVVYDDDAVYFGVRAFQLPDVPIIANELRRDAGRMHERNDTFSVAIDTFLDKRNGVLFYFNPLGATADWACWDEGRVWTEDWDTVWEVKTSIESWGWSAEMRLPFRSLRFPQQGAQRWGITLRRIVLGRNEWSYSSFIPPEWAGMGIGKFSSAGVLEGLTVGRRTLNVELDPYVLAGRVQGPQAGCSRPDCANAKHDVGIDAKYGLATDLTADLTYNTDFSQVDADEQQINFTRFNLFFPEKRQFFLEGKGIFDFGVTSGEYMLLPFFSRRIGLEENVPVPIRGGGRLTGKEGAYSIGALGIRTADQPSGSPTGTTFSVLRVQRDIFGRSRLGFIATDRRGGTGTNDAFGADFNLPFRRTGKIEGFMVRAGSPSRPRETWAGRVHAIDDNDRRILELDYLRIGKNFDPESGFVNRSDVDRWYFRAQKTPRLKSGPVRKVFTGLSVNYVRDTAGHLSTRDTQGLIKVDFHSADVIQVTATRKFDAPPTPFRIGGGLSVPAGAYSFTEYAASWTAAPSRRVYGQIEYRRGGYYDGNRQALTMSSTLKANRHFYSDVNYQFNDVRLSTGNAMTHLAGTRLNYAASTSVFLSTLLQWNNNTREFNANVRLNWIYRAGSDLYVVYTRTEQTLALPTARRNQSLVVKLTRLMRF